MKDIIQAFLEDCESKSLYAVMNFVAHPLLLQIIRQSAKLKAQVLEKLESRYEQLLRLSSLSNQQDLVEINIQLNQLKLFIIDLNTEFKINQVDNLAKQNDS